MVDQDGPVPSEIKRDEQDRIVIRWSDGVESTMTAARLRSICPCATCREKRSATEDLSAKPKSMGALPILSAAEARPLRVEGMKPVGSYAYQVSFSDGHSSGIFTFDLLRSPDVQNED